MASVTINDILHRAQEFELRLERYYAGLRDTTEDNGVKLLTYYLSRHRRHLEHALEGLELEGIRRVRRVRLKVDVPFEPVTVIMDAAPSEVRGTALLQAAVEHDMQLASYYRKVSEQSLGPEASGFIESLIRLEEKDIVMLKKMIAMNYF